MPGKDVEVHGRAVASRASTPRALSYVRIRKLEVRNFISSGIVVCRGHEFVVEDNYVHHCGYGHVGRPDLRRRDPPQHIHGHHGTV